MPTENHTATLEIKLIALGKRFRNLYTLFGVMTGEVFFERHLHCFLVRDGYAIFAHHTTCLNDACQCKLHIDTIYIIEGIVTITKGHILCFF
ncbi:hypothetical protein D3C73_1287340 [compost metagenome]